MAPLVAHSERQARELRRQQIEQARADAVPVERDGRTWTLVRLPTVAHLRRPMRPTGVEAIHERVGRSGDDES